MEEDLAGSRSLLQSAGRSPGRGPGCRASLPLVGCCNGRQVPAPGRPGNRPPRQQPVRVAHHRVTSAQQPLAHGVAGVLDPVPVLGRHHRQRAGDAGSSRGAQHLGRAAPPAARAARSRPSAAPTWRASSVAWAGTSGDRVQPAYADQPGQRRPRSRTTPTRPVCGRARNRSTTPGRSTRRGSRRRARTRARKSGQRRRRRRSNAPAAQVWASIVATSAPSTCTGAARRPAGGRRRPAARCSAAAEPRVAGQLVAGAEPTGSRRGRGRTARPAATRSSASSPVATRSSSSSGRSAGSTAGGPNRRSASTPTSSRSGRPRPGALAASTRSTSRCDGRPARLSRRSSSSCWAPGRNRPPRGRGAGRRPVAPRRRTAGAQVRDPGPGAGPAGLDLRCSSARGTAASLGGPRGQAVVGVGAPCGLEVTRHEGVQRGRGRRSRGRGLSGSCQPASGAGRTGRRSSRSPTTSMPAPFDPLDPPWATSLGPVVRRGRQRHRTHPGRAASVSWTTSWRTSARYWSRRQPGRLRAAR